MNKKFTKKYNLNLKFAFYTLIIDFCCFDLQV